MTEHQLRIWVKLVQQEIDKSNKVYDDTDILTHPHLSGLAKGTADGLAKAWSLFEIVEKGIHMKQRIKQIEREIEEEDKTND